MTKGGIEVRKARLVKMETTDGLWSAKTEKTRVGKVYWVRPGSQRKQKFFNVPNEVYFTCEVADVWDESKQAFIHFPTELLKYENRD